MPRRPSHAKKMGRVQARPCPASLAAHGMIKTRKEGTHPTRFQRVSSSTTGGHARTRPSRWRPRRQWPVGSRQCARDAVARGKNRPLASAPISFQSTCAQKIVPLKSIARAQPEIHRPEFAWSREHAGIKLDGSTKSASSSAGGDGNSWTTCKERSSSPRHFVHIRAARIAKSPPTRRYRRRSRATARHGPGGREFFATRSWDWPRRPVRSGKRFLCALRDSPPATASRRAR